MIDKIIHFSIRNKMIVLIFVLALVGWGTYSLIHLPVDAVPDITNNQVQVISIAPSLAVQEVERFITTPVETSVATINNVIELRSISRLGLSVVTVVFKDDVDTYWARQQISERLKEAEDQIPEGLAKIEMAPVSTGLGEIYQYTLEMDDAHKDKYNNMDLRTIQDWIVRRQMLGTPGVADVNSYGGFVKQYEVSVNPERLRSMGLTLADLFTALEKNNENTGSAYIDKKPNAFFIRGIGMASSLEDLEKTVIKNTDNGIPLLIRDVAKVQYGNAPRFGAFVADTGEAVGGVVMMLKGANAAEVIDVVEKKIETIKKSLPEGVTLEPYLDRSHLVKRAINTVSRNLIEGGLIVIFILVLMLGNLRAGIVVASVIPLSMLFAISLMRLFGVSGNLMSLGAIDFGLIVDGAVIIVESVVHHLAVTDKNLGNARLSQVQIDHSVESSSKKMMNSAIFGQIIILIVYLPIVSLVGIEGKMFRPMAEVVTFALIGAILLSVTYVPMATSLFMNKKVRVKTTISDTIMDKLNSLFEPVISYALRHKLTVIGISVLLFLASLWVFNRLGGEFIPTLEEGDLAAGVMTLQGGSLSNTVETVETANKILLDNFPEVKKTLCKIGAGEIPTDPTPMETGDYIITMKDKDEWTSAESREEMVALMEEKLSVIPGVKFEFQQPIQMRFNELMTGSKQDVAVKIFGDNLDILAAKGSEVEKILQDIEGVEDINVEKVTGLSQIQVEYDRDRLAQYGLSVSDVNRVLRTAFAGMQAGVIYEEEKRFDLVVRLDENYRQDIENVRSLPVSLPDGHQINLDQFADIQIKSGPAQVSREDAKRRITIGFNVRNRDVAGVIEEAHQKLDKHLKLPAGYYIDFGGQFENLVAARNRLALAVPVALLLIFILLYFTFHSVKQTLLIFTAVPLAAIGGVFALYLRGMNFSISAAVGFIALFGVAVLNGIVLIAEFNRLRDEGITDIYQRVTTALKTRLRPVLITAAVASLGFLPMALSQSAGAEVQRPLATVVIGGLVTSTLLTLVVLPVLYIVFSRKIRPRRRRIQPVPVVTPAIAVLMALTLCGKPLQAQSLKIVSLGEALQTAKDSNLNIRLAFLATEQKQVLRGAAWNLEKTELSYEYGQMNSLNKDNSYSITQSFDFPLVYIQQSRMAKAEATGSRYQQEAVVNEVLSEVKSTYWQLSYYYGKRKQLLYQDSLFKGFLRAAELRATLGETNQLEMLTARSQSLEINNQLKVADNDINIGLGKLRLLLGIRTKFTIADTVPIKIATGVKYDDSNLESNPMIMYSEKLVSLALINRRLAAAKMLPDFKIGYFNQSIIGSQEVDGLTREFMAGDRFTGLEAGISIPLWFFPHRSEIRAAKYGLLISKTQATAQKDKLRSDLDQQWQEYLKYKNSLDFYEQTALPEAELIIKQSHQGYNTGMLDYLDYIQSLLRAVNIHNNYLETLNSYNQAVIRLEYLSGINK
jgi:cobalt-zinc-cadmium resistance protein CzcA